MNELFFIGEYINGNFYLIAVANNRKDAAALCLNENYFIIPEKVVHNEEFSKVKEMLLH